MPSVIPQRIPFRVGSGNAAAAYGLVETARGLDLLNFTAVTGGTAPTTNTLTNPSFETDTTGWGSPGATLTRVAAAAPDGTAYGHVACAADATCTLNTVGMRVAAAAGQVWSAAVSARYSAGTARSCRVDVQFLDAAYAVLRSDLGVTTATLLTGAWQRITNEVGTAAPTGTAWVQVRIQYLSSLTGDAFDADAGQLEHSPTVPAYNPVTGGGGGAGGLVHERSLLELADGTDTTGSTVAPVGGTPQYRTLGEGTYPNQHPNPTVEADLTGWGTATLFGSLDPAASVTRSSTRAHDGTWSVHGVWPDTALGSDVGAWVDGHVAGVQYRATAWVYVPAGSPGVFLNAFLFSPPYPVTTDVDTWVQLTATYVGLAGYPAVYITIVAPGPTAAGTGVWVDDVQVRADRAVAADTTTGTVGSHHVAQTLTEQGGGTDTNHATGPPGQPMSLTPVTLRNAADAFVSEQRPSANFADRTRLRLDATTNKHHYSFIHFPRPFPLGAVVTSGTLRVYTDTYAATPWPAVSRTLTLCRVTGPWKVGRITYANQPDVTTAGQVTLTSSASCANGRVWEFDVGALLQLVADGTPWYGWRLAGSESTLRYLHSAQSASYKPTLSAVYALRPQTPTTLSPAGGRSVANAQPTLSFDFTDSVANTSLTAVQVLVNTLNSGWDAPAYDSGARATSSPEFSLVGTPVSLADGDTRWWKVRVQDGSGLWSDYSDAAEFKRTTKGTLTITNPAASPNNYVSEATPPIVWTLAGRTQAMWQVIITDSSGDVWLHNSGKQTGLATSYTLPKGILHDLVGYRAYVHLWDTVTRERTADATAYTGTYRDFTTVMSPTVTVVSAFTGTDLAPAPGIRLDWTRGTAPDSYSVYRALATAPTDFRQIDADVLPGDVLVSGIASRYVDDTADPRRAYIWQVRPVVNGATAASNPTVTKTLTPVGIWLLDHDRGIQLQILGQDSGDWSMGETAASYEVVGSEKTVRVTQALRGYEGSVSGVLAAWDGRTVDDLEQDVWTLKATPGRTYRLVAANMNLPVVIGNVTLAPTPGPEIVKALSFDFWQDGDLPFTASL